MRSTAPRQADHVRQRTNQRDLAIARVSRLTTGTAVAGALATIGFAGLAAFTFSGNATATDTNQVAADDSSSQDTQGLNQPADGSATTPGSVSNQGTQGTQGTQTYPGTGSTGATTPSTGSTSVNPPVTTTRHRVHVVTGGSH